MNANFLITILLVGGGAAFLFLTPQGRDILAQIQGMFSGFDTYDPQKTDLFPEGKEPADLRKGMTDFVSSLKSGLKTTSSADPRAGKFYDILKSNEALKNPANWILDK
jgi:hypothetical protein